jgi:hypothetical protein
MFDYAQEDERGFDYFSWVADPDGVTELPDSFKGWSGTGVWFFIDRLGGALTAVLCGIVFYQLGEKQDSKWVLRCHGVQSIYRSAAAELLKDE